MGTKKSKQRDLTTESIGFCLDTLGIGSEELLNLFHEVEGKDPGEYKNWLCQKILENSLKEDNIPLSQYKLKWSQFLAGLSGDFSLTSKVSTELRNGILNILNDVKGNREWVSFGGFEDLLGSEGDYAGGNNSNSVDHDETTGINNEENELEEFDWDGTVTGWIGNTDLYEELWSSISDEDKSGVLIVAGELSGKKSGKKTEVSNLIRNELRLSGSSLGEQRLYQLATAWNRGAEGCVDDVVLVLHNERDFWQKCKPEVLEVFFNNFALMGVVGEYSASHLYESAPSQKNQLVTVWKSHMLGEDHTGVEISLDGVVYYKENWELFEDLLTNGNGKGTGLTLKVDNNNIKVSLKLEEENGKGISVTEDLLEVALTTLAVSELNRKETGYGRLRIVPNGIEPWGKLVVVGVVLSALNDGKGVLETLKERHGIIEKYPLDLTVEGKQLIQAVENGEDLDTPVMNQRKSVLQREFETLINQYNL